MKFSDLLGDQQPDGEAPLAPDPTPPAAEPIGVLAAEPPTPDRLDRSSRLAAVNVAPEVAVPTATAEDTNQVEAFERFDDDLLPSARTRRNRR